MLPSAASAWSQQALTLTLAIAFMLIIVALFGGPDEPPGAPA